VGDWEKVLLAVGALLCAGVLVTFLELRRRPRTALKRQEEALLADLHSAALRVIQAEHFLAASEAEIDEIVLRLPVALRERAVARGIIGASVARLGRQEAIAVEGDENRFSSPDERRDSGEVPSATSAPEADDKLRPGDFAVGGKVFAFRGGKLTPR